MTQKALRGTEIAHNSQKNTFYISHWTADIEELSLIKCYTNQFLTQLRRNIF